MFYADYYDKDWKLKAPFNSDAADKLGEKGFVKIAETKDGKLLDEATVTKKFGQEEGEEIWKEASVKYAEEAKGRVTCYGLGAKKDTIFLKKELPTLLENEKVTFINGIPREELKSMYDRDNSPNHHESIKEIQKILAVNEPKNLENQSLKNENPDGVETFRFKDGGETHKITFKGTPEQREQQMDDFLLKLEQIRGQDQNRSY